MQLRILILNLNNLNFIKDCIHDLLNQSYSNFNVTIVDQGSNEKGTKEYLKTIQDNRFNIIFNHTNKPVNEMWNWFVDSYDEPLLCFLNNDVRVTPNFVIDTIKIFNEEPSLGVAVHATNHPKYDSIKPNLTYNIVPKFKYMQGWDYTIKRKAFTKIPEELKIYCGDDFLFHHIYEDGYDMAYITSSPIIHYEGQSKKFMTTSGIEDINTFKRLGFEHYLKINTEFSRIKPTYSNFKKYE